MSDAFGAMALTSQQKLVWGWLRLLLGTAQMGLLSAAIAAAAFGHVRLAWVLACAATVATIASRVLYHGRKTPPNETSE